MPRSLALLCVGASKNPAYRALEAEYGKKIAHYADLQTIAVKDSSASQPALKVREESKTIAEKLKPGDFVVLCDERGTAFSSLLFSTALEKWMARGKRLVVICGGAYGVSDDLRKQSHVMLKLSDFTLPHELARVVLLEQLYRGFTILKGEKYHHGDTR